MFQASNDMSAHINRAVASGCSFAVPLLEAAQRNEIDILLHPRSGARAPVKRWLAATQRGPAVAVLGDDDIQPTGPAGWPVAERCVRWARFIVLHGCAGEAEHYRAIVAAAQLHRTALLIETASAHVDAWHAFICRWNKPALAIVWVPKHGPHPRPETMQ